jgi:hypothetical protein
MTKLPKGWVGKCDSRYDKNFGPILVMVWRVWEYKAPEPTAYKALVGVDGTEFMIEIKDLGCEWHDDDCAARALKIFDRAVKAHIRTWAK